MPNIKSSIKSVKTDALRNRRNNMQKSLLKSTIRKFRKAVGSSNPETAKETLLKAVRVIDKSATKGIIHRNAAARKKSRLTRQFNKMAQAQE